MVYKFRIATHGTNYPYPPFPFYATAESVKRYGGTVIEHSAIAVETAAVDENGCYYPVELCS